MEKSTNKPISKLAWTQIYNIHRAQVHTLELIVISTGEGFTVSINTYHGTVSSKKPCKDLATAKATAINLALKYTRKAIAMLEAATK